MILKIEWFAEWVHNPDRDDWIGPFHTEFDAIETMQNMPGRDDVPFRVFAVYRWSKE